MHQENLGTKSLGCSIEILKGKDLTYSTVVSSRWCRGLDWSSDQFADFAAECIRKLPLTSTAETSLAALPEYGFAPSTSGSGRLQLFRLGFNSSKL